MLDRRRFDIQDPEWRETDGFGRDEKLFVEEMVADFGTGLERSLYEECLLFHLRGMSGMEQMLNVYHDVKCVGQQSVPIREGSLIKVTTFQGNTSGFLHKLEKFCRATRIEFVQWINIARHEVTFRTLESTVSNSVPNVLH